MLPADGARSASGPPGHQGPATSCPHRSWSVEPGDDVHGAVGHRLRRRTRVYRNRTPRQDDPKLLDPAARRRRPRWNRSITEAMRGGFTVHVTFVRENRAYSGIASRGRAVDQQAADRAVGTFCLQAAARRGRDVVGRDQRPQGREGRRRDGGRRSTTPRWTPTCRTTGRPCSCSARTIPHGVPNSRTASQQLAGILGQFRPRLQRRLDDVSVVPAGDHWHGAGVRRGKTPWPQACMKLGGAPERRSAPAAAGGRMPPWGPGWLSAEAESAAEPMMAGARWKAWDGWHGRRHGWRCGPCRERRRST